MSDKVVIHVVEHNPLANIGWFAMRMIISYVIFWQASLNFVKGEYLGFIIFTIGGLLLLYPEFKKIFSLLKKFSNIIK